jgi:hypothetical protein
MSLNITFGNGKTYSVYDDTVIFPSNDVNVRNRMEIHMSEQIISLNDFITLMSDENATMTMRHVKTDTLNNVIYDNTYTYYILLAEIGKRRCDIVDVKTGTVRSAYHLVAVLEQPTAVEQELREIKK